MELCYLSSTGWLVKNTNNISSFIREYRQVREGRDWMRTLSG
jgi:hypothetical protein